ncbi:family 43 glycosylhydrolase [Clostridium cellulovorans]|uniref:non-reducing end alpha-L-arabinofuranosidase n=2 Tax=Clostridium cellulovorans TaxID=1493 RepID=D9SQP2_CLOC7|nr:family 43 glycosylhydrolase [Clostridium cellulovorans]ADL52248.1 LPXTG-motif cell wall anchor domain protein [Clostridium cellulovorans 743B]
MLRGKIDDFRIYNRALSSDEVYSLMMQSVTDTELVANAKSSLELGDLSEVTSDLQLLKTGDKGVTIAWSSSDEAVINNDGIVTNPSGSNSAEVTLTATLSKGNAVDTKTFTATVLPSGVPNYLLDVNVDKEKFDISDTLVGLFFEDINHGADGGLYAELVENSSFEFKTSLDSWTIDKKGTSNGTLTVKNVNPLNSNNTHYLEFDSTAAGDGFRIVNDGYKGISIKKDSVYDFSVWARDVDNTSGDLLVRLEAEDGTVLSNTVTINGFTNNWTKYEGTLTANSDTLKAKLVVYKKDAGKINLDMISLFPQDTWKGRKYGLRKDLVQLIDDMEPKFLRFPGGCVIEGSTKENMYNWKDTIGNVEERKLNENIWGYYQSYGLGYYEYFQLCEDLGAVPVPVVNVGMTCQARGVNGVSSYLVPLNELDKYIQDALDLIEYANGDVTTTWGAKRAASGHPEPFNLKYLSVGNEQWGNDFYVRFEAFQSVLKVKHPEITLISTSGPSASGTEYTNAWNWIKQKANDTIVDEHYYMDPQWFLENTHRYDNFDRNGAKVFIGEYASKSNTLKSALAEAAYLTGIEKNSDVVKMASYAPLFAKDDDTQWSPDMIWFNGAESYATPNYYVQKLFSTNTGTQLLESSMNRYKTIEDDIKGGIVLGSWMSGVEYDDVVVKDNTTNQVIFSDDFSTAKTDWKKGTGNWTVKDGKLVLTDLLEDCRTYINNDKWQNYTLSVKAKKTSGNEGFLIGVGARDTSNFYWLNIGGWNNSRTVMEKSLNGTKAVVSEAPAPYNGNVVTGKEYDIKIEVNGSSIKCYIDGVLTNEFNDEILEKDVYTSSSVDSKTGDIIVKVVNTTATAKDVKINLNGVDNVKAQGTEEIVSSASQADVNSFASKTKVTSVKNNIYGLSKNFTYTAKENSVAVLRIKKGTAEDSLKTGLKVYYNFDNKVGSSLTDLSGNSNNGTLGNSANLSNDSKFGQGLNLDGNGYVKLPNGLLDDLNDITIATWVKYSSGSADWERVFDFGSNSNNFFFLSKNKHVGLNVNSTPQDLAPAGAQVNDTWIHVAVTLSNNTMIYYENGVEVARKTDVTNKPSGLKAATENYIGKSKFSDPLLKAKMDEFRIYNRALSASEITQLNTLAPQNTVEVYSTTGVNKIDTVGDTLQMAATVTPSGESVDWAVVDLDGRTTDLASIDANGLLTSKKTGTVMVVATTKSDSSVYGFAKVVITQKVDSLTLSGAEGKASITTKGGTLQVMSKALPSNATDKTVTWALTDADGKITNVATIDENGVVKARKDGSVFAVATAKDGSAVTAKLDITITGQTIVENEKLAAICPQEPNEPLLYDVENINNDAAWGTSNTHDPSIFKDGEWYYVFSTDYKVGGATGVGLQVRKSKDLINWQWVGRAFTEIPGAAKAWATGAENMWAPDVVKIGDTYYLYYTVSGFGTNNSFIGVATSKSIEGPWTDQGEVYKTKKGIDTDNALDPNIVADANGDLWLAYGSFFSGIFVSKIDKTTGKLVTPGKGTQISATGTRKNMEAPYIVYNPEFKKYYLFMSYDDLGVDYNVRVAWSDKIDGPYTDLNGKSMMETPTDRDALYDIGTKLIGSYAFGNDPGWMAPGHNSVLNDNGNFYLVHHARGGVDKNWAYLQVRKIVWSADGKPAVSPERYAGEQEQKIDQSLIAGKWQTIVQNRLNNNKLTSTDITLYANGKINDENGQSFWKLTGDNTLTLNYYDPGKAPGDYWVDTVKVLPAWDYENWKPTLVFTGYNQANTEVWGKQVGEINAKVTEIKVSTKENLLSISEKGGKLQMIAEVNPSYADDSSVTWSVVGVDGNATDLVTIDETGVLTAVKDGSVKVVATANDGSGVVGTVEIKISGQATVVNPDDKPVDTEKIIIKPVVDGVLQVIVNVIDNKDGNTVINLDNKAIDEITDITINDINSILTGTGNLIVNLENNMTIKLPYTLIDKSLLKNGAKIIFRTHVKKNSDLYKDLKGINKVFSFEMVVVNGTEETVIHQFASGLAEVSINLTDEDLKGLDKNKLVVLYYNESTKKYEEMETVVNGNKVTFKTPHFSEFIIAEKSVVQTPQTTDNTSGVPQTTEKTSVILPQTGSFVDGNLLLLGGIIIYLFGLGVVLISRKKSIRG